MKLPDFSAEASLRPTIGFYGGTAASASSPSGEVLPMLGKSCTNCGVVGGLGGVRGVGVRSCCETVWGVNPRTGQYEPVQVCWSESCMPDVIANPWMSFD
jgi:hypothetical protein